MSKDRIECFISGRHLTVNADDLRIEISNRSCGYEFAYDLLTVEADDLVFFAAMGLPEDDVHGDYAEWADDNDVRFATPDDRKAFKAAVESAVERHYAPQYALGQPGGSVQAREAGAGWREG